ncbi:hypothetical protein BHM03_00015711 [Ensete ventricosum]|nr:hypothetical protein BHM03_00015711 [Ensete ventricosum]
MPHWCKKPSPVVTSKTNNARTANIAALPFQVSALLVQPHSHTVTGGGSSPRFESYAARSSSTLPSGTKASMTSPGPPLATSRRQRRRSRCLAIKGWRRPEVLLICGGPSSKNTAKKKPSHCLAVRRRRSAEVLPLSIFSSFSLPDSSSLVIVKLIPPGSEQRRSKSTCFE